jgi:hypothetical protein
LPCYKLLQHFLKPSSVRISPLESLNADLRHTDAATAQSALASPKCTDFIIPVRATAPTKLIDESSVPQNLDDPTVLIDFLVSEAESRAAALLGAVGTIETIGTFNMSMRYCEPTKKVASRANSIQYLQHAITNTKNYWNGLTYPLGVNGNK